MEASKSLSFDSESFMTNFMKKMIERKTNDHFILLEEYFFTVVMLYKKNYEVQFEELSHKVLDFFS
jgi:hypothetical protein